MGGQHEGKDGKPKDSTMGKLMEKAGMCSWTYTFPYIR